MRKSTGTAHQAALSITGPRVEAPPVTLLPAVEHGLQQVRAGRSDDAVTTTPALPAAMLTTLLMHLPCGVIVVDTAGSVAFMNEAGQRLSREIKLGSSSVASSVLPGYPGMSPPVTHGMRIARALAGDAVPDVDYVRGVQGGTEHRVVQVAITTLRDGTARITGALITLTDLTERVDVQATLARVADALAQVTRETLALEAGVLAKKAVTQAQDNYDLTRSNTELEQQATLARAADALAQVTRETLALEAGVLAMKAVTQAQDNRELTRSNAGLEQFASVASHDLLEPLRKIQAFGDRLKSVDGATLSPAGSDYLERMQQAAARMRVLVNDLLAYARVAAEPRSVVPVDLAAATRAVLTDLEMQVAHTGGQVEVGPLPTIEGDPLRLRQLLQNLISNALKFRRPEVPSVVIVSAVLLPREDTEHAGPSADVSPLNWLRLTVEDNGIGFEQKYAERIFEGFKRLNGRSAYEGTGIGLALCRQIAEQHGGHITATSTPGQGATLRVTLPLRQTEGVSTP
jgi:signal transduction histidine kinase